MHKYRAKPTELDCILFHSKKEAGRYAELKLLEHAGEISDIEVQPQFKFCLNDKALFRYLADFKYFDCRLKEWVVEDVKGVRTDVYRLKKKLIEAQFGIKIVEV